MDWMNRLENADSWQPPAVPGDIPHGDMPGDKVEIGETHIAKANLIFPELLKYLREALGENAANRAVVAVCGGSGVGKSEIASLLSFYLNELGIGSYTLSGDNYPHRIPAYNDAERLHIFRESGLKKMIADGVYTAERFAAVQQYQRAGTDADAVHTGEHPWYTSYLEGGKAGLAGYLGTDREIGFEEVSAIVTAFKSGAEKIWLKRMGRAEAELWYEEVDFSKIKVLIIEWTHGNSDCYEGVDVPILLNSTPQETLAHRRARNRDGKTDSAFTMCVLELEQAMLESQAHKAKLIVSKEGGLLSYEEYRNIMREAKEQLR